MAQGTMEVWMRGPIPGIPERLQPIAHAIMQAREEVREYLTGFDDSLLWLKPGGVASVGFHVQHLTGVLDRLFCYAEERPLTEEQLEYLSSEGKSAPFTSAMLVEQFSLQVDKALDQLKNTDINTLLDARGIGRKQIPTNVQGLLFHAAEHTQRHVGQLLVTVKLLPLLSN